MAHLFTNKLIEETSPYLLQHAHNPVNWYPWGEEALEKARQEDKIILVSIGYSACHWCHVMEKESFENEQTAQLMNEYFINIKIDREERPDLDHIYMDAVQAITGSGGWPLNVFLTPEKKPFYGGTYYPPVKAFNRSSWKEVLESVQQTWLYKRHEVISQADNLIEYLKNSNNINKVKNTAIDINVDELFKREDCHTIFQNIMKNADREWGGFGKAPKFPQTFTIQYLLQYYHFSGVEEALRQAVLSLDKMLQGGIYDHIGGGLARYSTDREWLAPHFEKMLYDNALLINVLCDAFQITHDSKYEQAIRNTIRFVIEELMNEEGGFYAALDADSDGEEGTYYVWKREDVENILKDDAVIFCDYFNITQEGNWEEKNILRILVPDHEYIKNNELDKSEFEKIISSCLLKLKLERSKRVKPSLDDKILLSWNALMLNAISKAAAILQDKEYKAIAEKNFIFILTNFKKDKNTFEMYHTFKNGYAKYPAFLDDYAYLIAASISLYEITFNVNYLHKAKGWCDYATQYFSDNDMFFFFTNKDQKDIIVRKKEIYDGAIPSSNAVMANNLYKLSVIFDNLKWKNRSISMSAQMLPLVTKYPTSFGFWCIFLLQQTVGINEISIIGKDSDVINQKISIYCIPNKIVMSSFDGSNDFPMLANRYSDNETLVYLCHDYSCMAPFKSAEELLITIQNGNKL
ncbi:MAG: thioredoxin domain-containing protein [Sphingobacteriales bacterium]|nr:thioredoxin domain-containing protein [Sphingobacteriales bacterium]